MPDQHTACAATQGLTLSGYFTESIQNANLSICMKQNAAIRVRGNFVWNSATFTKNCFFFKVIQKYINNYIVQKYFYYVFFRKCVVTEIKGFKHPSIQLRVGK